MIDLDKAQEINGLIPWPWRYNSALSAQMEKALAEVPDRPLDELLDGVEHYRPLESRSVDDFLALIHLESAAARHIGAVVYDRRVSVAAMRRLSVNVDAAS